MSTRYNTGNPIESTDVRDMSDNAKNFDDFANSKSNEFTDRFGVERKTIHGMNSQFDSHIMNMGFTRVGTFAAGATLTNPRQTLLWDVANGGDGQEYGWSGVFPKIVPASSTPASTGGVSVGAWISRFDPELRIQVREALRRSYAEAGYNLVDGSFEAGGTLENANDVLLRERTGKAFSGPVGTVAAGTNPASCGFVDKSGELLRNELATSKGAAKVGTSDGRTVEQRLAALPNEVDAAGTAASLIAQHNNDYFAHTHLTEQIAAEVRRAELATSKAEVARDAALAASGPLYATIAGGRATVADGQTFAVQGAGNVAANIYRRINASSETLIASLPSVAYVDRIIAVNQNLLQNGDFSAGYAGWDSMVPADLHKFVLDGRGHITVDPAHIADATIFELLPMFLTMAGTGTRYPVVAGKKYTLSAEIDVDAPTSTNTATLARMSLRCFDSSNVQLLRTDVDITKLNRSGFNNGLRNFVSLTAPANTAYMTAHLYRQPTPVYSVYGIGNVKVEQGDMSAFSVSNKVSLDDGNLLYDPTSGKYPPVSQRSTITKDAYGEAIITCTQLNVASVPAQLYESHKVPHTQGCSYTWSFELDAAAPGATTAIMQISGFDINGTPVWGITRTLPIGTPSSKWGFETNTRSLASLSGTPPNNTAYVLARITSSNAAVYTKLIAKRLCLKKGTNNFEFSNYSSDVLQRDSFIVPSSLPSSFEFWPKGWQTIGGAYAHSDWIPARDSFGEDWIELNPALLNDNKFHGMISLPEPAQQGDVFSYSFELSGELTAGSVVVGLSYYDPSTAGIGNTNVAYNFNIFTSNFKKHSFEGITTAPEGTAFVALRILKNITVRGTRLRVKNVKLYKSKIFPLTPQLQGDMRAISDEIKYLKELSANVGDIDAVGWAVSNPIDYYTGNATSAFMPWPSSLGVAIDTPPELVYVDSSTHIADTRLLIMAPGIVKVGSRLWSIYSAGVTADNEAADDFNIVQYSDDDGMTWKEIFYWNSPDTTKYRLNTPHIINERDGSITFLTGYDATFSGGDNQLGVWAFTVKNPTQVGGVFIVTRQWRILPIGYPNCVFTSDGRDILLGGTPTSSTYAGFRGVNFYKYDPGNRWVNREARYEPITSSTWTESQAVQLKNGNHMLMFRSDSGTLKVSYSAGGLDSFTPDVTPPFLPATTAARFALKVSPTGRLYLLYNASTERKQLTLAMLNDTGTAVVKTVLIEPRQEHRSTYPDLKFDGDNIYMVWDWIRSTAGGHSPEIVMAKLSEADFVANGAAATLVTRVIATKNPNPHA